VIVARSASQHDALEQAGQLSLFACFDTSDDFVRAAVIASNDDEGGDDPLVSAPIIKRVIPASQAERIQIKGPVSVFDMGYMQAPLTAKVQSEPENILYRVTRDSDVTRCQRIQIQDTQEWKEKEAARRARQVLPKPPKQEFRMGRRAKVLQEA
jgi:hypothetical protein